MNIIKEIANLIERLFGVRTDYVLHFGVCFLSSLTSYEGAWAAFGAGVAAEYKDSITPGNRWDWWDLFADGLGIAAGAFLRWIIKNYL